MTGLLEFTPMNGIEETIASMRSTEMAPNAITAALSDADLFVSSRTEVLADGSGFEPLLFGESSSPLVGIFTAPERPLIHRDRAEYMVQMTGRDFFRRMPSGYGVVVNPGYLTQFVISADAVTEIKNA
jgi:hypothetical protein